MPPAGLSSSEIREAEPYLLRYARRALGGDDAAADLVQETLLAAVGGHADFAGRSAVRTWLVGILSHKIIDHFRKRTRAGRVLDSEAAPEDLSAPASSSPEHALGRKEALTLVEAALADLPELERMAILLIDVEGHDHDEACNVLEVRATHLRVLLHRGRHRLRKALENAEAMPTRT
jgi:RNA polymerase sigma-70 factor (ECF subfamily)